MSSEVNETQRIGRLASPLHIQARGNLLRYTHKQKSSKDIRGVQEKHLPIEIIRVEQQEVRDVQTFRADEAVQAEQKPLSRLSAWNFTREYFLRSKGIRYSLRKSVRYVCRSRGRNVQQMPSASWTDNFVLNILKSTVRSGVWRIVTGLNEINVLKPLKKWRAWEFQDLGMASSSGSLHVPSQPVPSFSGEPRCDFGPQLNKRDLCSMLGNFRRSVCARWTDSKNKRGTRKKKCMLEVNSNMWRTHTVEHRETSSKIWWNRQGDSKLYTPQPEVCRKRAVPTVNPPSFAEEVYSQNFMVDSRRTTSRSCSSKKFPAPSTLCWKTSFTTEVYSGTDWPSESSRWIWEVELPTSVDDLKTSRSVFGHRFPRIRDAWCEDRFLPKGGSPKFALQKEGPSRRAEGSKMTGSFAEDRMLLWSYEHFWVTGTHVAVLDCSDQFSKTWHGDDVQGFDTRWDEGNPSGALGRHFGKRGKNAWSDELRNVFAVYEQDIEQHNSKPGCQKLKAMVKGCTDQKIRARNFEVRNERIETGAAAKG